MCHLRPLMPQPMATTILLPHCSWAPLQMASPVPFTALIARRMSLLRVLAKLQSAQMYLVSVFLCTYVSRICYLKWTLAQQPGMAAALDKRAVEPAACSSILSPLLCDFSVQTWEFISGNSHPETSNLYFSLYTEEKVTEWLEFCICQSPWYRIPASVRPQEE